MSIIHHNDDDDDDDDDEETTCIELSLRNTTLCEDLYYHTLEGIKWGNHHHTHILMPYRSFYFNHPYAVAVCCKCQQMRIPPLAPFRLSDFALNEKVLAWMPQKCCIMKF
ncbi:CLUMA_CG009572, isoform A [Clunio marinus]|uniref:CLUMA_CG009572, isoform A n=1 Tax=Clunio marinus TaxID=568069 RepID=A0A1J1IAZ9_9DIPT|nr:CLUMA_CG009572, isoform A [Clunio marinus]